MSREQEIADKLRADPEFMAIMTGGTYTDEEVGVEGIRRGNGTAAFDDNGLMRPCVLVRQRDLVPDEVLRDQAEKFSSVSQIVEVYYYQFRGHAVIDAGKERAYQVLEGERLSGTYPIMWNSDSGFVPDVGPVANSTTLRQEWRIVWLRKP